MSSKLHHQTWVTPSFSPPLQPIPFFGHVSQSSLLQSSCFSIASIYFLRSRSIIYSSLVFLFCSGCRLRIWGLWSVYPGFLVLLWLQAPHLGPVVSLPWSTPSRLYGWCPCWPHSACQIFWISLQLLLLFSNSVASDSLWPHGLQHARPPYPSPSPGTCSNSCLSFGDTIQSSHPLLSPSSPTLNLSQHEGLFQWVRSSHQVAKVLELQLQHQSFQRIFRTDFL